MNIAEAIKNVQSDDVNAAKEEAAEAKQIATVAQELKIHDESGFEEAGAVLVEIKGRKKNLEARRKLITKPMMEAKKEVDELFKVPIASLTKAESALKGAIGRYVEEIEKERQGLIVDAAEAHESGEGSENVRDILIKAEARKAPKLKGVSLKTLTKFEITDEDLLPRHLLTPDMVKIRAAVKAGMEVPGIRVWEEKSVAAASGG